jgi:hypothetical protein
LTLCTISPKFLTRFSAAWAFNPLQASMPGRLAFASFSSSRSRAALIVALNARGGGGGLFTAGLAPRSAAEKK